MKDLSGKIGQLIFSQRKSGKTSVYVAPEIKETPTRSKLQMLLRLAWVTLAAIYVQFHKTLKRSHEGLKPGTTDYNAFLQDNTKTCRTYITKTEKANGGCILLPCLISRGSLQSIDYQKNGSGVMVTDLALGTLAIDADTTIADFSVAVITQNEDYVENDQLTFFSGTQKIDSVTGTPRAKINGYKVRLDLDDETPLWNVVTPLGFTSIGGYLGMSTTITDGACAWIHSRDDEQGDLKISTQSLYVDTTILATYTGDDAFNASVASYGGLTSKKDAYLRPDEETNTPRNAMSEQGSGQQSGGQQSGGSSNSGNAGTSGTGGQEPPTVAAPVISGTTPFEETTTVTMSCSTAGATIHYTTDGSTPTAESTQYSSALTLSDSTTIKAIAIKDNATSTVTSKTFTKGTGDEGDGDVG